MEHRNILTGERRDFVDDQAFPWVPTAYGLERRAWLDNHPLGRSARLIEYGKRQLEDLMCANGLMQNTTPFRSQYGLGGSKAAADPDDGEDYSRRRGRVSEDVSSSTDFGAWGSSDDSSSSDSFSSGGGDFGGGGSSGDY